MITKKQEQILRKQFSKLKKFVKGSRATEKFYLKNACPDLYQAYATRWDINMDDIIDDVASNVGFKGIVSELRIVKQPIIL